jgi:DNA-binding response OmpR family regulator
VLLLARAPARQRALIAALRAHRFDVHVLSNAAPALRYALLHRPHAILVDVHPVSGGALRMLETLRKDHWGARVPVIVHSTRHDPALVLGALRAGVRDYLGAGSHPAEVAALLHARITSLRRSYG